MHTAPKRHLIKIRTFLKKIDSYLEKYTFARCFEGLIDSTKFLEILKSNKTPNKFSTDQHKIAFKVVFHSKLPIFAIFLNIHKASPNTDHNIICMLKRKTTSKPEKSSLLSYTNQGKTTILPRAN